MLIHGVGFKEYVAISEALGDRPGMHVTYLEGTLELMTVSPEHEHLKKMIARLLELYALLKGVRLLGFGSTTYRREAAERGLEPDECYCLGEVRPFPDLAIEVVITSGGIDKLEVYRGLGVREVWIFSAGKLTVHALRDDRYVAVETSMLIPGLDLEVFTRHALMTDQDDAVRAYWAVLKDG